MKRTMMWTMLAILVVALAGTAGARKIGRKGGGKHELSVAKEVAAANEAVKGAAAAMTFTGVIEKKEAKGGKGGDGAARFSLTAEDGTTVELRAAKAGGKAGGKKGGGKGGKKAGKKGGGASDPAAYVGQKVTVTGQGSESTSKKGKKRVTLTQIESIRPV